MAAELFQVLIVSGTGTDLILVAVVEDWLFPRYFLNHLDAFEQAGGVLLAAAQVVYLTRSRILRELPKRIDHVVAVNLVADLLAFVAETRIGLLTERTHHKIIQEPMQLDASVMGTGETAAPENTGLHAEVASVLLGEHIAGQFRSAKQRMERVVDWKCFWDAVNILRISIVPTSF